jgi:replicative DNA helicase
MPNEKKTGLMAEQWAEFERKVLPDNVSQVQRREMRRAFYSGAQAILFRVIEALAPESEPTDADLAVMAGVHQELQDFAAAVKRGLA